MTDRFEIIDQGYPPYAVRDKLMPADTVIPVVCKTRADAEILKAQLEAAFGPTSGEASKARIVVAVVGIILVAMVGWVLLVPWMIFFTCSTAMQTLIEIVPIVNAAIRKWALKPVTKN
jgi:hypothetical protein